MDYENTNITEDDVIDALRTLLWGSEIENTLLDGCDTRSYSDGGYLTCNKGFTLDVGSHRFQITVRQEC